MTIQKLTELLSAKIEKMEDRPVINLSPSDTISLALLQNILGVLTVIANQQDIIIQHLDTSAKEQEKT